MSVSSTEFLHRLDAILYNRPAGRNIIDYAIETINDLRKQGEDDQTFFNGQYSEWEIAEKQYLERIRALVGERDDLQAFIGGMGTQRDTLIAEVAEARAQIAAQALKVKAWAALVAWQKAENSLGVTENEVFPLMLAYEEAAKAAGWW